MAYRRRHGITRSSTFKEEIYRRQPPPSSYLNNNNNNNNDDRDDDEAADNDTGDVVGRLPSPSYLNPSSPSSISSSSSSSLAAQAIRASAAHRRHSSFDHPSSNKGTPTYDYTSMRSSNEAGGFWGVLARKAKSLLDEDDITQQSQGSPRSTSPAMLNSPRSGQFYPQYQSPDNSRKMDNNNPKLRKGLDALTTSLNHIGGTLGNAFEEGRAIVENKTADIIQETRKLQTRRIGGTTEDQNLSPRLQHHSQYYSPQSNTQTSREDQLKASRDVAMATAAKAKLLLRELKTVKADLAFAKLRCSQLEEENKMLREGRGKRENPADDDLIRNQLETLLAEKARLAHENSVYARENRFLREIVEYHQLTMQDVVYLDEGIEEVTEVYPIPAVSRMLSASPPSPASPSSSRPMSPSPSRKPSDT